MAQLRNVNLFSIIPYVVAAASLSGLLVAVGCEGYHNEEERLAYKRALDAQEAKLYPAPANTLGYGYDPPDPTQCPNNGQCIPDPGARAVAQGDCDTSQWGLEFLPLPVFDFEDTRTGFDDKNKDRIKDPGEGDVLDEPFALLGYTYRDDTTLNFYPFGWEPRAIPDPFGLCGREKNHIFHIAGGPFIEWGGGFGRSLRCMNTTVWTDNPTQKAITSWRAAHDLADEESRGQMYCHVGESAAAGAVQVLAACASPEDTVMGKACPKRDRDYKKDPNSVSKEELAMVGVTVDVSEWEGISFWGRRGPNSQPGIRVLLGDKYTDDDISFAQYIMDPMQPRYCERTFECKCKSSSRPCTEVTEQEAIAINNALNSPHNDITDPPLSPNSYNLAPVQPGDGICWDRNAENAIFKATQTQYCGQRTTKHQSDSAKSLNVSIEPLTFDTTCQEFSFRGSVTSDFMYNPQSSIPAQQKPAEASQNCGDHWMKSVDLDYDWKFITIPFTEFLQQNWAKRSYKLDLTALSLVRLTWDRGYIDYYIDDVRFYRKKKM